MRKLYGVDLGYVAALLEGEGSFMIRKHEGVYTGLELEVGSKDPDVIEDFYTLVGFGRINLKHVAWSGDNFYVWRSGVRLKIVQLIKQLYPLMHKRRQRQIRRMLRWHKDNPPKYQRSKHGTRSYYNYYKCRCSKCCKANQAWWRAYRRSRTENV